MEYTPKSYWKNILRETKSILEEYGWIQGETGNCKVGFCLTGAIEEAANRLAINVHRYTLTAKVRKLIRAATVTHTGGCSCCVILIQWNDSPSRTLEEVMATLDTAAELAN